MNPPHSISAIVCHRNGSIEESVCLAPQTLYPLESNQLLVRPVAAPINPADLNLIEGTYAIRPELPFVLGMEGVGIIEEIGSEVTGFELGQPVIAPLELGWWCERRIIPAANAIPLPMTLDLEQAAMLTINPPTALRMLEDFVSLKPGEWIVQNAANSGVGRNVIQIARHHGIKTINIVRRAELIPELKSLGADIVVAYEKRVSKQIGDLIGGEPIRLGLNAVSGECGNEVAKCLTEGGTMVTYGAMSREPLTVSNGLLIFKNIHLHGFAIRHWFLNAGREAVLEMYQMLIALMQDGILHVPIEKRFALHQAHEALHCAAQSERRGKILFRT